MGKDKGKSLTGLIKQQRDYSTDKAKCQTEVFFYGKG